MTNVRRIIGGIVGFLYGVAGAAALVLAGFTRLDRHTEVLGLHHTGLLGWIELVYGILVLAAAFSWGGGGTLAFLGALATGLGVVVFLTDAALHPALGVHAANAVVFVVSGIALVGAGLLSMREARSTAVAPPA